MTFTLTGVNQNNDQVYSTITLESNSAPAGGTCTMNKLRGQEMVPDEFLIECLGFADEVPSSHFDRSICYN